MSDNGYQRRKILLVDDDEDIRHALRMLFEFEEFEVVGEAANGVEAVALAMKEQPHFIVLDYLMPRMDGAATAEVLRAVAPDTRIVAFSAILKEKPEWSDAYLNKEKIAEVAPLLRALL